MLEVLKGQTAKTEPKTPYKTTNSATDTNRKAQLSPQKFFCTHTNPSPTLTQHQHESQIHNLLKYRTLKHAVKRSRRLASYASNRLNPNTKRTTTRQNEKSLPTRDEKPKPRHAIRTSRRHSHSFPQQNQLIRQNRGENKAVHPHKTYFESINHLYQKIKTK